MVVFPNSKINLGLDIVEKRADGYHNIETVFYPIPLCDILEIVPNSKSQNSFETSGIPIPSDGKPNLVERAWALVNEKHKIPFVDIHLKKIVPIGAGLGGGSADAAFAVTLLNELFELKMSEKEMLEISKPLGADCAFFIKNKPVYAEGVGDDFSDVSVNLKGYYLHLIYPNIHVSTPIAYKNVTPAKPTQNILSTLKEPIENWKGLLKNDFENSVFKEYSKIESIKSDLYNKGAIYAAMSGSGSSVFGLFKKEPQKLNVEDIQEWIFKL